MKWLRQLVKVSRSVWAPEKPGVCLKERFLVVQSCTSNPVPEDEEAVGTGR